MPEVAEVAHVCAQLRRNIIGSRIVKLNVSHDPLLFPILKTSANPEKELANIKSLLDGSVVEGVGRHGKYFWIRFKGNSIMLMHFGMTGMIKLKNIKSHLIFMENGGDKKVLKDKATSPYFKKEKPEFLEETIEEVKEEWPPRFSKLELSLEKEARIEFSFADARRLGRIRFFTGIKKDSDLFELEPLSRQGPDYSKSGEEIEHFEFGDPDPINYVEPLSLEEFGDLITRKRKPIKSLLLEQDYFAGVGNWVSDEILYQARIHPSEILSEKVKPSSPAVAALYSSLKDVCKTAVSVEGNVKEFPESWLMLYRWGKRRSKQEKPKVGGYPVDFITIGGRTSCFVPKLQKKL